MAFYKKASMYIGNPYIFVFSYILSTISIHPPPTYRLASSQDSGFFGERFPHFAISGCHRDVSTSIYLWFYKSLRKTLVWKFPGSTAPKRRELRFFMNLVVYLNQLVEIV